MKYTQPNGCKSAVTCGWETTRSGGLFSGSTQEKFTAKIYCGDRQATCEDSFNVDLLNIANHRYYVEQTVSKVSAQVAEVLGAICLGCPHNTERIQTEQ